MTQPDGEIEPAASQPEGAPIVSAPPASTPASMAAVPITSVATMADIGASQPALPQPNLSFGQIPASMGLDELLARGLVRLAVSGPSIPATPAASAGTPVALPGGATTPVIPGAWQWGLSGLFGRATPAAFTTPPPQQPSAAELLVNLLAGRTRTGIPISTAGGLTTAMGAAAGAGPAAAAAADASERPATVADVERLIAENFRKYAEALQQPAPARSTPSLSSLPLASPIYSASDGGAARNSGGSGGAAEEMDTSRGPDGSAGAAGQQLPMPQAAMPQVPQPAAQAQQAHAQLGLSDLAHRLALAFRPHMLANTAEETLARMLDALHHANHLTQVELTRAITEAEQRGEHAVAYALKLIKENGANNQKGKPLGPTKGVERRYSGKGPWREYVKGELSHFFLLHGIPDTEQGVYAYMALDEVPRAYVNAVLGAPANEREHTQWIESQFRRAGGLGHLTDVMSDNPSYALRETGVTKLDALNALTIRADAADLASKFARFQQLVSDLRQEIQMSPAQEFMHLLQLVRPCRTLYNRIRMAPDKTDWFAGQPPAAHAKVLATVYKLMFVHHTETAQLNAEQRVHETQQGGRGDGGQRFKRKSRADGGRGAAAGAVIEAQRDHLRGKGGKGGGNNKRGRERERSLEPGEGPSNAGGKKPRQHELDPRIAKVKAYRGRNGMCFYCGEKGHVANACPGGRTYRVSDADVRQTEESARKGGKDFKGKGKAPKK